MLQCRNFLRYRGSRPPTCNGGFPCDSCLHLWDTVQASRSEQKKDQEAVTRTRSKQDQFHANNCYGTSHYCVCK